MTTLLSPARKCIAPNTIMTAARVEARAWLLAVMPGPRGGRTNKRKKSKGSSATSSSCRHGALPTGSLHHIQGGLGAHRALSPRHRPGLAWLLISTAIRRPGDRSSAQQTLGHPPAGAHHPQPRVPLMRRLHVLGHGPQYTVLLLGRAEEAALESQLDLVALLVHLGVHDKQAVALPCALLFRRVAAPHGDGVRRLLDHFEVICDLGAWLVCRGSERIGRPEVVRGRGFVFLGEVAALEAVAWMRMSRGQYSTVSGHKSQVIQHEGSRQAHKRREPHPSQPTRRGRTRAPSRRPSATAPGGSCRAICA